MSTSSRRTTTAMVNAVGWGTHGHKFRDLTGSDKAGFQVKDPSGTAVLSFNG